LFDLTQPETRTMRSRQHALIMFTLILSGSAMGQVALPSPQPAERAVVRTTAGRVALLIDSPQLASSRASFVDHSPGKAPTPQPSLTITDRVILRADADITAALRAAGYDVSPAAAGYAVVTTSSVAEASALVEQLAAQAGVSSAAVEMRTPAFERTPLDDPFYANAWHLFNEDNAGNDINAEAAWDLGVTGAGVNIGIVDGGTWTAHPDLAGKHMGAGSQSGGLSSHATSVAGVAVASGNNQEGAAGIAYGSTFSRLYFSTSGDPVFNANTFTFRNDINDIKNNSWGPSDTGVLWSISPIESDALLEAVTTGRDGKGTVFVWAGGNGSTNDRVEYDPYASSFYTIAIGAITTLGKRASYSERGSALMAVTYSDGDGRGIVAPRIPTTNNPAKYTFNFGGTSSASPLAAGAIALCLEANPDLTWRDVQHLIVETAKAVDPSDPDWTTNGAGFSINHNYGFGQLDAAAMVAAAKDWSPVEPSMLMDAGSVTVNHPIPDNDPAGFSATIDIPEHMTIEQVAIDVNAHGTFIGDLQITLTSPDGTDSIIATNHPNSNDVIDHTYYSLRHWGEDAAGTWTLNIADLAADDTHTFDSFALRFFGTALVCHADQDNDGAVTASDFEAWMLNFANGDMQADVNGDGVLNAADFPAWIAAFNQGC